VNNPYSTSNVFPIADFEQVKKKVLNWCRRFSTFCFLDNHQYQIAPHTMECLLGAGIKRQIKINAGNAIEELQHFLQQPDRNDRTDVKIINKSDEGSPAPMTHWLFGHLGYDLKNEIETLVSAHPDQVGFADLFFFEPEIVIRFSETEMVIEAEEPHTVFFTGTDKKSLYPG
jgi:para-aminobenzoate synthetase component I